MTSEVAAEPSKRSMKPHDISLVAIEQAAQHAERRLRTRRAILWAAKALGGGLVVVVPEGQRGLTAARAG